MKVALVLAGTLAIPVAAQQGQQTAASDPLTTWLRQANVVPKNRIVTMAERMPEDGYGMRPGTQTGGRTFGQYLGHVANLNYVWCSQARGERNPNAGRDLEKLTGKAELMKAVQDAFGYCDGVYGALTDASGLEIIEATQENGQPIRTPRVAVLILNYAHNNEVFGNLNTFMRIKGL
jgi:hypothetical protein